jgi:hypothetical protein
VENTVNGYYQYFTTGQAWTIKAGKHGAPLGNQLAIVNKIKGDTTSPVLVADTNSQYGIAPLTTANGQQLGDAVPAAPGSAAGAYPATAASVAPGGATLPVNAYTKRSSGTVNDCDVGVYDAGDFTAPPAVTAPTHLQGVAGNVNH